MRPRAIRSTVPAHVVLVDLGALLLAVVGFHMAFRQRALLRAWDAVADARGKPSKRKVRPEGEDPLHYALIIFGMMLLAFGVVLFGFTTLYWMMTRGHG